MTRRLRSVRVAAAALLLLLNLTALAPPAGAAATSALDFRNGMRKLWEDHITYTRLYIIEFAAGVPAKDATAARLLQNQVDIGNAIRPYYGDAAGDKLTALLKEHILGAVAILDAAKAGDKAKLDTSTKAWYDNADAIAVFLNSANPKFWPLDTLKSMMKMHLDLTLQEAVDRLGGKYADDAKDYDKVHDEILTMADALSDGIIGQFPDRFDQTNVAKEWPVRSAMRRLWEDHIQYTRFYIVEFAAGIPAKDATAARLLQNQVDIGNAAKPYVGAAAGDKLTALLKEHILGAVAVLDAAKAGDKAKLDTATKAWYANANDIAAFLSSANPSVWPLARMQAEMKMHLDLTTQEAVDRLGGKFADDIKDYDKVHDHILGFADLLSTGVLAASAAAAAPAQVPTQLPRTGGVPLAALIATGWLVIGAGWLLRRRV